MIYLQHPPKTAAMLGSRIRFLVARFLFIAVPGLQLPLDGGDRSRRRRKVPAMRLSARLFRARSIFKELHKLLDAVLLSL